jgi:hypothetical protein
MPITAYFLRYFNGVYVPVSLSLCQVVKVHQNTVDTYLEDIILSAVDGTASEQARNEIQQLAAQVNEAAYAAEKRSVWEPSFQCSCDFY